MDPDQMIIDVQMPEYDVGLAVHKVIDADPATTFAAARQLDFLTVRTPLLNTAMWLRGLPDKLRHRTPPPPAKLTLVDGAGLPGWLSLGKQEDQELAFGAVGKFWQPHIEWRQVPAAEFRDFREPGWGKIACNFTVRAYGTDRTLLTYECRTATTDAAAQRKFAGYWRLIRPFVAHIMRALASATIAVNAEPLTAQTSGRAVTNPAIPRLPRRQRRRGRWRSPVRRGAGRLPDGRYLAYRRHGPTGRRSARR